MLCYYIYIDIYFLKRYIKQKYAEFLSREHNNFYISLYNILKIFK